MDEPPAVEFAVDDAGRLAEDVECRHCGYNLRGLTVAGCCPECRTSVGRSVHGDLLQFCDPDWVERLAAGMRLYVLLIVLGIVFGIVISIALAATLMASGTIAIPLVAVAIAFGGGLTVLQVFVYWRITSPDPGRDETSRPVTARAVARLGLVVASCVSFVTGIFDPGQPGGLIALGDALKTARWVVAAAAAALGLIGMGALFIYAIALARRLPDDGLARSTRTVMWGFLITTGLMHTVQLSAEMLMRGSANPRQIEMALGIGGIILIVPGFVFWIWGIVLLFKYRNRLVTAASRARRTWARPG